MVGLYGNGPKTMPGSRETWMDRFTQLEPGGGVGTVYLMWRRRTPTTVKRG